MRIVCSSTVLRLLCATVRHPCRACGYQVPTTACIGTSAHQGHIRHSAREVPLSHPSAAHLPEDASSSHQSSEEPASATAPTCTPHQLQPTGPLCPDGRPTRPFKSLKGPYYDKRVAADDRGALPGMQHQGSLLRRAGTMAAQPLSSSHVAAPHHCYTARACGTSRCRWTRASRRRHRHRAPSMKSTQSMAWSSPVVFFRGSTSQSS